MNTAISARTMVLGLVAMMVMGTGVAAATDTVRVTEGNRDWYFSSEHYDEDGELVEDTGGQGAIVEVPEEGDWGEFGYWLEIADGQKARVKSDLFDGVSLSELEKVEYSTYKTGLEGYGPSVNIEIDPQGDDDFATLVWEANKAGHDIDNATWQDWDTSSGDGWWTPSIDFSSDTPGSNQNPTDLAGLLDHFGEDTTIVGFAINVGRHSAMEAYVDGVGVTLDGDTTFYDFEPTAPTKQDCKDDGWEALGYRNQGRCVSDVARQQ